MRGIKGQTKGAESHSADEAVLQTIAKAFHYIYVIKSTKSSSQLLKALWHLEWGSYTASYIHFTLFYMYIFSSPNWIHNDHKTVQRKSWELWLFPATVLHVPIALSLWKEEEVVKRATHKKFL